MKFYEVYCDSCGDYYALEYFIHKANAEAMAKELNDDLDDFKKQFDHYGVLEHNFKDDPDE